MNEDYHLNRFYAQERLAARYREAENYRLARQGKKEDSFKSMITTATRVAAFIERAANQAARSLEKLGQSRVQPLHR
jgi:hypothetical protein